MTRRIKKKSLDPSKYGMIFCPQCMGAGRIFYQDKSVSVCSRCGGFGLIKKEINVSERKEFSGVSNNNFD
jgi:rRNA maturation endonuclease Nob1